MKVTESKKITIPVFSIKNASPFVNDLSKLIIASFLVPLCLLIFASFATAQGGGQGSTPLASAQGRPAGSYQLSDIENINYFNGQLNISIPITTVQGRGTASFPLAVHINSSNWSTNINYVTYGDGRDPVPIYDAESKAYVGELGRHSWKGMFIAIEPRFSYRSTNTNCYGSTTYEFTLTRIYVMMPDGTETELRDTLTDGALGTSSPCTGNTNRGRVFVSKDGSSVMFKTNTDVHDIDSPGSKDGTLYFKDGTTYRVVNGETRLSDKNGNYISFQTVNKNPVDHPFEWDAVYTDPNGRITKVRQPVVTPSPQQGWVEYNGTGGAVRQVLVDRVRMSAALYPGETIKWVSQLFGNWNWTYATASDYDYNPDVISKITLPNGKSYEFKYNSFGELKRIDFPTGSAVEYDWSGGMANGNSNGVIGIQGVSGGGELHIYRRLIERRVYDNGTDLTSSTTISRPETEHPVYPGTPWEDAGYVEVKTYGPQILRHEKHYFHGKASSSFAGGDYAVWKTGREYQTEILSPQNSSVLRRTTQLWQQTPPVYWINFPDLAAVNNPHVVETTTLLADSNQISKRNFAYDANNNLTDTYEYDYGTGAPGSFLRRSHTDYLTTNPVNNVNYTSDNIHILGLPTESWVSSDVNGNNKISLSKYEYDNYASDAGHAALVDRFNISGHDLNYGANYTTRGQVTKVTSYADAQNQGGPVSTYMQYDIAGNLVKAIDAKGNASTISYNDNFGSPDAEARNSTAPSSLNGQQTYAFATSATNVAGYTGYTQFDYYTGAGVDAEDFIGNVNTTFYNDVLGRPTQTISANNRPQFRTQATAVYDDINRKVTITADSKTFGDNLIKSESFYDKMGRTTEARQYEDATNYTATQQQYDSLGRAYKSSNPFRPYLSETPEWSTTGFDALGRVIQVKTPDNAFVSRSYSGTTTTVTDQSLRKRSGTSDALGRLLKVVEDPTGLNYQTDYTYDLLGRLRKTTQTEGPTTQNRYFMYNDLGRLIRAKQVEQNPNSNLAATDPITGNSNWSVGYSYDNNGNIVSTTDANNRTIAGTYDNLNRLTFRDYSEPSMPDVTFTFDDLNIANSKGQLTAITSSVSATNYTAFDELGRIKSNRQTTNGQIYNFPDYSYDFSGALVSQTYPSGRVVAIETDNIGRLSGVTSQAPNGATRTYLNNISYNSFGAVEKSRLGNGVWESAKFDSKRLQVTQIGLGASAGDTSLLKIDYEYGSLNAGTGQVIAGTNNGNLAKQTIAISAAGQNAGFAATQYYAYDALNRLQTATENVTPQNQTAQLSWRQQFIYDRFGNRRFDAANTTTLPANTGVYNPSVNTATNRFAVAEGYNYDNEGNLTTNPENQLFTYDSENRQTQVQNTATQQTANYFYDGNGKRVRKVVGNQETIFVYDAFGKLTAEYTTNQPITTDGTKYLTADALGSPRAITDISGNVISRHDYMPFGEEAYAGIGGRTATQGYLPNGDGVRQQFTGYEKDLESGLDYAQARYYSGKHGRFTSVDPLTASANIKNPQTFNRYSYGLNSPYKFTDPLGLTPKCQGPGGGQTSSCDGNDENGAPQKPCPELYPDCQTDENGEYYIIVDGIKSYVDDSPPILISTSVPAVEEQNEVISVQTREKRVAAASDLEDKFFDLLIDAARDIQAALPPGSLRYLASQAVVGLIQQLADIKVGVSFGTNTSVSIDIPTNTGSMAPDVRAILVEPLKIVQRAEADLTREARRSFDKMTTKLGMTDSRSIANIKQARDGAVDRFNRAVPIRVDTGGANLLPF